VATTPCELCRRQVDGVTRHHLIPRTRHRNRANKKRFDRSEVRSRLAWLCRPCHKQVHALLDEKELERTYNTIEALRRHPDVARFVRWIRSRPADTRVPAYPARSRR
jgi:hypothetical protein